MSSCSSDLLLAAVDGEMCAEQAEKLRIIRSHMDSLQLCKLDLESLRSIFLNLILL